MGFEPGLARDGQCCCASGTYGAWPHPGICVLVLSRPSPRRNACGGLHASPPPPPLPSTTTCPGLTASWGPSSTCPRGSAGAAFPRPSAESHSSGSRHGWEASSCPGVAAPGPGSNAHLALPPVTPAHTAAPLQASSTLKGAAVPSRLFFSLPKYYLKFAHFPVEGPFSCKHQILPLPASPFLSDLLSHP